jgi:hypothetical protein
MCITAKAIFMVDFDDFGWLFMADFSWLFMIFGWLFMAGCSSRIREGRRGRERENINKKKCKQMKSE